MARSYEVLIGVKILIIIAHGVTNDVVDVHAIAQEATDTTEAFDELEAIRRLVRDELD